MRTFILLFICLALSSCASMQGGAQQNAENWRGKSVSELTAALGSPAMKSPEGNGNVDYIYVSQSSQAYSTPTNSQITTVAGPSRQAIGINTPVTGTLPPPTLQECLTVYQVNPQGIIVGTSTRGDGC